MNEWKKVPEMLVYESDYPVVHLKAILTFFRKNNKKHLQNIPYKNSFCLISWIFFHPFDQDCSSNFSQFFIESLMWIMFMLSAWAKKIF